MEVIDRLGEGTGTETQAERLAGVPELSVRKGVVAPGSAFFREMERIGGLLVDTFGCGGGVHAIQHKRSSEKNVEKTVHRAGKAVRFIRETV